MEKELEIHVGHFQNPASWPAHRQRPVGKRIENHTNGEDVSRDGGELFDLLVETHRNETSSTSTV